MPEGPFFYSLSKIKNSYYFLLQNLFNNGKLCVPQVDSVCLKGRVFGRMRPHQKAQLLERLNGMDLVTVMCGDGANDCGVRGGDSLEKL